MFAQSHTLSSDLYKWGPCSVSISTDLSVWLNDVTNSHPTHSITDSITLSRFSASLSIPDITSYSPSNPSSSETPQSSRCVLLCSVMNVTQVTLSWYRGSGLLSSISIPELNTTISLHLEVEHEDNNTYSCVLNNPISQQARHLNISEFCHTTSCISEYKRSFVSFLCVYWSIETIEVRSQYNTFFINGRYWISTDSQFPTLTHFCKKKKNSKLVKQSTKHRCLFERKQCKCT